MQGNEGHKSFISADKNLSFVMLMLLTNYTQISSLDLFDFFIFRQLILVDSVKIGYLATNMQFLMAKSKMY